MLDTQTYYYETNVDSNIGFNVGIDKIYFGTITEGTTSKRPIRITNNNYKNKVIIKSYGKLADKITISENNLIMHPKETKELEITLKIDQKIKKGKYTGKIIFLFIRQPI